MALTATAQSALPREPAWDEVIVPTLRKRLKDESTALANRMSAASMASADDPSHDHYDPYAEYYSRQENATPTLQYPHERPTAIPRPSLQQSRNGEEQSRSSQSSSFVRARTYSQPFGLDSASLGASVSSEERRPISPSVNGKATRIPVSRGRSGSTSSHAQASLNGSGNRAESTNANSKPYSTMPSKKDNTELWVLDEGQHSETSRSTVRIPRRQASELFDEPAPFAAKSLASSGRGYDYDQLGPERASSESEERPFEHWYRGDVSRNGGVGELRVGRRQEMLDIANYGHTFRKASSRVGLSPSSRSRSNSRSREASLSNTRGPRHHRAESVGARQSIYLDEDEHVTQASMVLDEQPPSDIESDRYEDDGYLQPEVLRHPNGTISTPSLDRIETYTTPADTSRHRQASRTRIPTPTRRLTSPARTPSPPQTSSAPSTPRSQVPRSQSQPQQAATKRAAKSPARPTGTTASKKARTRPPPSSMQKKPRNDDTNRRSIGQYPTPESDDMADAIPTWTQPVPASGNWDDVVLPVVARKKGLEGHYVQADGSTPPPKPKDVYAPQPGTFGYDHSKYRPPQDIAMDEFGQRHQTDEDQSEKPLVTEQPTRSKGLDRNKGPDYDRLHRPSPPPSPAPFAHYAKSEDSQHNGIIRPPQFSQPPSNMAQAEKEHEKEEESAGCCKCVIM